MKNSRAENRWHRGARCLTFVALAPLGPLLGFVAVGCGGSSGHGSGSANVGGVSSFSSLQFPGGDTPRTGTSFSALTGVITRVNGTAGGLGGVPVAVFAAPTPGSAPSTNPLASTTTSATGGYALTGLPAGLDLEVEVAGDAAERIHVAAAGAGETVELRCHLVAGRLDSYALVGAADRAEVETHLGAPLGTTSAMVCRLNTGSHAGAIHRSVSVEHAPANASVVLMVGSSASRESPLVAAVHLATDASGNAAAEVPAGQALDDRAMELQDASGNTLLQGSLARLPSSAADLESRRGARVHLSGSGAAVGDCDEASDDVGDGVEIEIEGLTPGDTVELLIESAPGSGTLGSTATAVVHGNGRAHFELGEHGTAPLPSGAAHTEDLAGRKLEIHKAATILAAGAFEHLTTDF